MITLGIAVGRSSVEERTGFCPRKKIKDGRASMAERDGPCNNRGKPPRLAS
jgi:hypothetical protein